MCLCLALLLLQSRIIWVNDLDVLQLNLKSSSDSFEVLLAQFMLFSLLFFRQADGALFPSQLIDSLDELFSNHERYPPDLFKSLDSET